MNPALYVAGTDTGVGKTRVATALCRALRERGLSVGVFKPAETGCEPNASGKLVPADAVALREAAALSYPIERICPYRLRDPLAPAVAAAREGVAIDPALLIRQLNELRAAHDVVICEGAGGLMVPLTEDLLNIDWIRDAGLPVLLVGRLGLGTINHTLLSARALAAHGIKLAATLLSVTEPPSSIAEETNPEVLTSYPELRFAGLVEHGAGTLPETAVDSLLKTLGQDER